MLKPFPYGSLLRFPLKVTDQATGQPVDPTDVKLSIEQYPNAAVVFTYGMGQVQRDGVGLYHYDYLPPAIGNGLYAWECTGAVEAGTTNQPFAVAPSLFLQQ